MTRTWTTEFELAGETFEESHAGSFIKGMYGDRYLKACERERRVHENDKCTPEQERKAEIEYKGWKCKVWYYFVPDYSWGNSAMNHWVLDMYQDEWVWFFPLNENIQTLEEAVKFGKPYFEKMIDRLLVKL